MPSRVIITDDIKFDGQASHRANVEGNHQEAKVHLHDHFVGQALDSTNDWAVSTPGTGDSVAISAASGGVALMTTGSVDDDSCMIASQITWYPEDKCVCEARIKITDVSGTALFFGFSDAQSEANNSIAIHYAADSLTTVATNGVGFVCDADSTTLGASSILCCGVKANSDEDTVDTGTDWVDGEWHVLRVELDGDEATFYLDGVAVAFLDDATTATTGHCVTVQAMTRANDGSNTVSVDRIDAWQNEDA